MATDGNASSVAGQTGSVTRRVPAQSDAAKDAAAALLSMQRKTATEKEIIPSLPTPHKYTNCIVCSSPIYAIITPKREATPTSLLQGFWRSLREHCLEEHPDEPYCLLLVSRPNPFQKTHPPPWEVHTLLEMVVQESLYRSWRENRPPTNIADLIPAAAGPREVIARGLRISWNKLSTKRLEAAKAWARSLSRQVESTENSHVLAQEATEKIDEIGAALRFRIDNILVEAHQTLGIARCVNRYELIFAQPSRYQLFKKNVVLAPELFLLE